MAAKKKRTAEAQLTKDTPEDETGEKTAGSWKEATGTSISHRKILRVKRKDGELEPDPEPRSESDSTSKSLPSFDFGVESSESTPSFDFQWKGSDAEKDVTESAKEGGEKEAAPEGADSTGSSSWNFSWGSDGGGFGAFDASAFKSFGSVASSAGTESAFSTTGSDSLEATASAFVEQPPPVAASALAFKDGKAEKAGTEDDQTLLRVQSKVYVIREESPVGTEAAEEETAKESKKEQKFVESGHGDLHVNLFQEEGKTRARLVLRMEKTQRLVLNAPIFKDMDYQIQGEKFLRVVSFDLEGKPTLYLLKFKTKQEVQQVKAKIEAATKRIGEPYGSSAASQEPEQEAESEQTEETA